jgi:hypothetical protein
MTALPETSSIFPPMFTAYLNSRSQLLNAKKNREPTFGHDGRSPEDDPKILYDKNCCPTLVHWPFVADVVATLGRPEMCPSERTRRASLRCCVGADGDGWRCWRRCRSLSFAADMSGNRDSLYRASYKFGNLGASTRSDIPADTYSILTS